MKKLVFVSLVVFAGSIFAQESKVPTEIKAKFQALYPSADEVKWDVEENDFEVNFESEDTEMSLLFNSKGNIVEIETALEEDDMPEIIEKSVERDFKGWELKEGAKIVRNGKTTYEAELEKGERKMDAIFTQDGKLLKKIEKAEKDEDGEKGESNENDEEKDKD